jgi:hypothetical protein
MHKYISLTIIGIFFTPSLLQASSSSSVSMVTEKIKNQATFCSQIDNVIIALSEKTTPVKKSQEKQTISQERGQDPLLKLVAIQKENNTKRQIQIEELTKRATLPNQEIALRTFTASVTEALIIKDKATKTIILSYQKEIDRASTTKKELFDKALETLMTDIKTAKEQAKKDCLKNSNDKNIQKNLKDAINTAEKRFKAVISLIEKNTVIPVESKNTRKAELTRIEDAYKRSLEQAKNNLKQTLHIESASTNLLR